MNFKLILASILTLILGTLMLSQVNFVKAENIQGGGPISYTITGKVLYRYNGWYKPATSAVIEALNITTKQKFTTVADRGGNYSLTVPINDYKVRASDARQTVFAPVVRYVTSNTAGDNNFLGILKIW